MSCSQECYDAAISKNVALSTNEFDWKISKIIQLKNESEAIAGGIEEIERLCKNPPKTVFDFDLNSRSDLKKKLLQCIFSLSTSETASFTAKSEIENLDLLFSAHSKNQRIFLDHFIAHSMNVCSNNQFNLRIFDEIRDTFVGIGNCLLPFASLINHSCDPNIFWIPLDMKFVFIVAKPVKAGEQLFLCYR